MVSQPASVLPFVVLLPFAFGGPPDVGITGVVEPVPGVTTCEQGTHPLACTGVLRQGDGVGPIGRISLTNVICFTIYPIGGIPCIEPQC